ncbi:MAG: zinc ribbon domain-containing protein [Methanoregula sp.]|jgi:hypothetical protein|nr:zinc ribbon domain-containing protein [Methanoregula sp.]
MGDPELRNDEKVLLRTPGVYVKSIPFEGILTDKRVILVDRAKSILPPKEIPFATIKNIESGENAIRDQIITLSVMAKTGDTRQMILTFSRREGGNRIKERDEWVRAIRQNLGSASETVIRQVSPVTEPAVPPAPAAKPRISVVNTPMYPLVEPITPAPSRNHTAVIPPVKKIIEAGPTTPVPPAPPIQRFAVPVEGQHIFCSRCGNKVPADSAFCNRCGSPIIAPAAPASAPQPVVQPIVPAAVPATPSLRSIDQDIRAIEPLIERSTVKIPADPLRQNIPNVPVRQSLAWDDDETPSPVPSFEPATTPSASAPASPVEKPVKKGILPRLFSSKARTQDPSPAAPAAVPPVPQKPRRSFRFAPSRNLLFGIGAIVLVLVIVAVGVVFVYPMLTSGETSTQPGTSVTTTPSSSMGVLGTVVPIEIKTSTIPLTGVQIHVNYLGGFKGSYGMPDDLTSVPGNSGDRVWEVENASGTVVAEFEKLDGSSHEILVEIYKNGVLLTKDSTIIGHGSVKLSADTTTGVATAPVSSNGGATVTTAAPVTTTG